MFTAGSLFSGIGGIDLAFSLAGFDIRYQVEINPFCRKVLRKHARHYWPHAIQYTDVQQCGMGRAHHLPPVDILFGGFPCQDISDAGKRAGIREGTRSGLWYDFARIISDVRPRVVFLENVAAITRRGGSAVLADLAEMGYVGQAGTLYAADAGAPHLRERWFCVGYAEGYRNPRITGSLHEAPRITEEQNAGLSTGATGSDVGHPGSVLSQGNGAVREQITSMGYEPSQPERTGRQLARRRHLYQPGVGRDAHGFSRRVDGREIMSHVFPAPKGYEQLDHEPARTTSQRYEEELTAYGNGVVSQVIYPIAKLLAEVLRGA